MFSRAWNMGNFQKPTCAPQLPSGSDAKVVPHHLSPGEAEHFTPHGQRHEVGSKQRCFAAQFFGVFFWSFVFVGPNIILKLVWYLSAIEETSCWSCCCNSVFPPTIHTPLEPPSPGNMCFSRQPTSQGAPDIQDLRQVSEPLHEKIRRNEEHHLRGGQDVLFLVEVFWE